MSFVYFNLWQIKLTVFYALAPIDPDDLASLGRGPPVEEFRQALLQEGRGSGPRRAAAGTGPVRRSGRAGQVVHC